MNANSKTLDPEMLHKMNAYWRAANYLSVGQIYLYDNPLLREPLQLSHVKPLVVGHWGTTPGQNFIYVHLNRVIKNNDLEGYMVPLLHLRQIELEVCSRPFARMAVPSISEDDAANIKKQAGDCSRFIHRLFFSRRNHR
jgi:hypothetical protein